MKYKTAEKDESMIINSDEYKRLKIENECDTVGLKDNFVNVLTSCANPPTPKIVKNINTIPLPPRRVPSAASEESLVLKLPLKRLSALSPRNAPLSLSKKKSPTSCIIPNVAQIDAAMETRLSLETISQFLDRIPESKRRIPLSLFSGTKNLSSIIRSMSYYDVTQYLRSLRTEYILKFARPIITKLMQHPKNMMKLFNKPVDTVELPCYLDVVKTPMDLGTIFSRLQLGCHYYDSVDACFRDMQLVFDNAILFNSAEKTIHKLAVDLKKELISDMQNCIDKCLKEVERKKQHSCSFCCGCECHLCGEKCLKFEPSVQICHGSCGQRIKKNSIYFLSSDCSYLWCYKCYNNLPSVVVEYPPTVDPSTGNNKTPEPLLKKNLIRRKSDEEIAEAWVECDSCGCWVHQVCALYDEFDSSSGSSKQFQCPLCTLQLYKEDNVSSISNIVDDSESEVSGTVVETNRVRSKKRASWQGYQRFKCSPTSEDTVSSVPIPSAFVEVADCTCKVVGMTHSVSVQTLPNLVSEDLENQHLLRHEIVSDSGQEADAISNISDPSNAEVGMETFKSQYSSAKTQTTFEVENEMEISANIVCDSSSIDDLATAGEVSTIQHEFHEELDSACDAPWKASSLPRSKLGDFLENIVKEMLASNGFVEAASTITVRLCSNRDHKMEVPRSITENLMTAEGYRVPDSLAYRLKCILLFQKIDGIDVCLFCLYVHEFDETCPPPNTSTVYIAYLDSVNYFRPTEARTMVYQEVVIGYLQWAQARGFKHGHIWSCPPQRGENFMFNCHPSYQKTPSRERLNSWYNSILMKASHLGILSEVGTLGEKYFAKYSKRDENPPRQAAKNSFVSTLKSNGLAKVKSKVSDKRKLVKPSIPAVEELPSIRNNSDLQTSVPPSIDLSVVYNNALGDCPEMSPRHNKENITPLVEPDSLLPSESPVTEMSNNALASDSISPSSSKQLLSVGSSEELFSVPICPPIFEGDMWVMEWVKVSRNALLKRRGGNGKDRNINYRRCRELLRVFQQKQFVQRFFNEPVDPVALNLPTYFTIIDKPMDLGTVGEKLRKGFYATMADFYADIELTFRNAMKFNPVDNFVHINADLLLADFRKAFLSVATEFSDDPVHMGMLESTLSQFPLGCVQTSPRDRSNSLASVEQKTSDMLPSRRLRNPSHGSLSSMVQERQEEECERKGSTPSTDGRQSLSCFLGSPLSVPGQNLNELRSPQGDYFEPGALSPTGESSSEGRSCRKRKACRIVGQDSSDQQQVPQQQVFFVEGSRSDECYDFQLAQGGMSLCRNVSMDSYGAEPQAEGEDPCVSQCHEARQQHELMISQQQTMMNEDEVRQSYLFSARDFNRTHVPCKFIKPALAVKTVVSMTQELCKSVQRLNDDLFYFKFAPPCSVKREAEDQVAGDVGTPSLGFKGKISKGRAQAFLKRRMQLLGDSGNVFPRSHLLSNLHLVHGDPDSQVVISPLVDSRHSFLEMCQFRHYQFDSLRRAQHSSLMILYYLHHPFDPKTRPTCHFCRTPIRHVRWHCDQCPNWECCQGCYEQAAYNQDGSAAEGLQAKVENSSEPRIVPHEHPLTPFRVSFF
mmetsp:Transcript_3165/g.4373  ORF Transcript_3165/g.4373 Transcript_3165/m.4373 type:complete len:1585 (+) Transcript_3165:128-4882(+)